MKMKNLISSYTRLACNVYSGEVKRWGGYEILHALCRMGGVGAWVLVFFYSRLMYGNIL